MQGVYCPGDVHWAHLEATALAGFCCLPRMEEQKRHKGAMAVTDGAVVTDIPVLP